jgi:hypothetical protein
MSRFGHLGNQCDGFAFQDDQPFLAPFKEVNPVEKDMDKAHGVTPECKDGFFLMGHFDAPYWFFNIRI